MELVEVCGKKLPVVPQRHARLRHHLKTEDFQKILSAEYSHESYRILSILIPALPGAIPEWEWDGYGSQENWDKAKIGEDAYVDSEDNSPTGAEIVEAFETALMVNGANRLGKLLSLVQSGATLVEAQQTASLPVSPGANGGSPMTSTGVQSPT